MPTPLAVRGLVERFDEAVRTLLAKGYQKKDAIVIATALAGQPLPTNSKESTVDVFWWCFIFAFLACSLLALVAIMGVAAAYRNGVTDGYGYAREPSCPGYQEAGRYLREHMAYRWPELRADWPHTNQGPHRNWSDPRERGQ